MRSPRSSRPTLVGADLDAPPLSTVAISPGARHVHLSLSGLPIDASVRVSWRLRGDHKKAADPDTARNGTQKIFLNWKTQRELLDDCLVVDVWSPLPLPSAPMMSAGGQRLRTMRSTVTGQRFTAWLQLSVRNTIGKQKEEHSDVRQHDHAISDRREALYDMAVYY